MEIHLFDFWPCLFYVIGSLADCIWTSEKNKRLVFWRSMVKSVVFVSGFLLALYVAPSFTSSIAIILATLGVQMLLSTAPAEKIFRRF